MLVSPEIAHESSQVIVLGRGIEMVDGLPVLGEGSQQRAEHAIGYYFDHSNVFTEQDARIVCSGGFSCLSGEDFGDVSEASMMADILVRNGVPHWVIEREGRSRSTLQNFLYSAPMLTVSALSTERPLGIVSHGGHLLRAVDVAHKVLGSKTPLDGLITPGEDDNRRETQECIMRNVWRVALSGIAEGDAQRLLTREEQISRVAGMLRKPLSLIIK